MSDYRERAQTELARIAAEETAKRAAEQEAANGERLREEEEQRQTIVRAQEKLDMLDVLQIPQALKQINEQIWSGRGTVSSIPIGPKKDSQILGVKHSIVAEVPIDVWEKTEEVGDTVYGEHDLGRTNQSGSWSSFMVEGWYWARLGDRVVGPGVNYDHHEFSVSLSMGLQRNQGVIGVKDFKSSVITYNLGVYTDPQREYSEKVFGSNALDFDPDSLDLEQLSRFLDDAYLQSAVARTANPIEPAFLSADPQIAKINRRVGMIINQREIPKFSPWWKVFPIFRVK